MTIHKELCILSMTSTKIYLMTKFCVFNHHKLTYHKHIGISHAKDLPAKLDILSKIYVPLGESNPGSQHVHAIVGHCSYTWINCLTLCFMLKSEWYKYEIFLMLCFKLRILLQLGISFFVERIQAIFPRYLSC